MEQHKLISFESKELSEFDPTGVLKEWLPNAMLSVGNVGGSSQTKYMDKHLNIGERPTLLGKARQCLTEIYSIVAALQANPFDLNNPQVKAAVQRCVGFLEMYKDICHKLEVEIVTDEMIEAGQPEEQLKTMFMQALRSAGANGGLPDEGSLTYANQVGVSVSECILEVEEFLLSNGKIRKSNMKEQNEWLGDMWSKYCGSI
jgi:hypothetical protein